MNVVKSCSIFLNKGESVVTAKFLTRNVSSFKRSLDGNSSTYEQIAAELAATPTTDDDLFRDLQLKLFGEILDAYEGLEKKTQGELHKLLGHKKLESFKSRIELLGYHRDNIEGGHKTVGTRLMSDLEQARLGDVVDLPCGIYFSKKYPK